MKREKAILLNGALMTDGLKVKFLSAPVYVKLLGFKRSLTKYISDMGDSEKELAKDMKVKLGPRGFETEDESFKEKLAEIQKTDFEPKELNFIELEEFKKFTDEVDFSIGSILSEYLLKESHEKEKM